MSFSPKPSEVGLGKRKTAHNQARLDRATRLGFYQRQPGLQEYTPATT